MNKHLFILMFGSLSLLSTILVALEAFADTAPSVRAIYDCHTYANQGQPEKTNLTYGVPDQKGVFYVVTQSKILVVDCNTKRAPGATQAQYIVTSIKREDSPLLLVCSWKKSRDGKHESVEIRNLAPENAKSPYELAVGLNNTDENKFTALAFLKSEIDHSISTNNRKAPGNHLSYEAYDACHSISQLSSFISDNAESFDQRAASPAAAKPAAATDTILKH